MITVASPHPNPTAMSFELNASRHEPTTEYVVHASRTPSGTLMASASAVTPLASTIERRKSAHVRAPEDPRDIGLGGAEPKPDHLNAPALWIDRATGLNRSSVGSASCRRTDTLSDRRYS